ncbi:type I-E CRISPR-associated protein Cse1/CasA [Actinomycetaceae bacterium L2_0104]
MAEDTSFNLIDEPWVLVRFADGKLSELSLRDVFLKWKEIRELVGELPTVNFAIQRLFLAILYRAAAEKRDAVVDFDAWFDLWEKPDAFGADVISYLEGHRDRFDLRHPASPFFQVAGLRSAKNEVSSLERLVVDSPLGGLFTMRTAAGLSQISWAEAARWLVHVHAFDVSGIKTGAVDDPRVKGNRGYPIGVAWTGQIGGIALKGNNLFESLLLNMVPVQMDDTGLDYIDPEDDLPPWECAQLGPAMRDDTDYLDPTGPVDLYTWQSRRVRLVGNDTGVTGVVLAQGDRMRPQDRYLYEPMTAWRYSEPQSKKLKSDTYMPLEHSPSRAFWRSLPAFVPQLNLTPPKKSVDKKSEVDAFRPPETMRWLHYLTYREIIDYGQLVPVEVFGIEYGSNNSVISNVMTDSLSIPASILANDGDGARFNLRQALEQSERVGTVLGFFAKNLAVASGLPSGDATRDSTRAAFYSQAGQEFREWISTPALDREEIRHDWEMRIGRISLSVAEELVIDAPETAIAGREVSEGNRMDLGTADVRLRRALRAALPSYFTPRKATESSDGQGSESE